MKIRVSRKFPRVVKNNTFHGIRQSAAKRIFEQKINILIGEFIETEIKILDENSEEAIAYVHFLKESQLKLIKSLLFDISTKENKHLVNEISKILTE